MIKPETALDVNQEVSKARFKRFKLIPNSFQFSSVAQSCPTLCDPMVCNTPGFLVHHQPLEITQTHLHWVGDATQPSHALSSPSPPTFNHSHHKVFSNESVLHIRWPKYWSFSFSISPSNEHPGLISLLPPNYHDSLEDVLSMVTYCQHVTKSQVLFLVLIYWCLVWPPICIWHLTSLLQFPFSIGFCYPDIYLFYFYFSDHSFSDFV